jgi:hypothetical protein
LTLILGYDRMGQVDNTRQGWKNEI